jgi:hypothetical protein
MGKSLEASLKERGKSALPSCHDDLAVVVFIPIMFRRHLDPVSRICRLHRRGHSDFGFLSLALTP